jgi:uncharacterized protein (DUF3820 family)
MFAERRVAFFNIEKALAEFENTPRGDIPSLLDEYRLTFGKHKGKTLKEVPDSYITKYLVPLTGCGLHDSETINGGPQLLATIRAFRVEAEANKSSEYRINFGKHKGKTLKELPDSYLVKYLIPRTSGGMHGSPTIVEGEPLLAAIREFVAVHPEVKSQAGTKKTVGIEGDFMKRAPPRKTRKDKKLWVKDGPYSWVQVPHPTA